MRITLQVTLGASTLANIASASYAPYNCGPCIPMMPCPCPMASMAAPMVMQAPQMVMAAPQMMMQVASQANVRPCTTQTVAVSSSDSSVSNSVTGASFNTGDISSIIKGIMKAEMTNHWSELLSAISTYNSRSDSSSVTNNYYTQNNQGGVNFNWAVFIQGLINRLEEQPDRTPKDERDLRILYRLRDKPPTSDMDTQTTIIEDPAPRPRPDPIVRPIAPLEVIPVLAIGWNPSPTDLIPAYASGVPRYFDPKLNPLVDFWSLIFSSICEDSLCRSGATNLARMVIFLNYMTNGTGTTGLRNRFSVRDWISVGGPGRDDIYIQLLRDSLNKFHHTFCLGNSADKCAEIKPMLVSYFGRMLSLETELADDIRSFVIILLTNGSNALDWKRVMNFSEKRETKPATTTGSEPPRSGKALEAPFLIKDKEPIEKVAKELNAILADNTAKGGSSTTVPPPAPPTTRESGDENVNNRVNNIVNTIVKRTLSPEQQEWQDRFSQMIQAEQIKEIMRLLDVRVRNMMGQSGNRGLGMSASDAVASAANRELIERAEEDAEAQRVAQKLQSGLVGDGSDGSSGAGTMDKVEVVEEKPKAADLIVAIPEQKAPWWTETYKRADRLAIEDVAADDQGGVVGGQQSRLGMYKEPRFVFARHLSDYLREGVKFVIPVNRAAPDAPQNQLMVMGKGGQGQSSMDGGDLVDTRRMKLTQDGEKFAKLLSRVLENSCRDKTKIGDARKCLIGAQAMAHLLALIDENTNYRGVSVLEEDDGPGAFDIADGDAEFNDSITEGLGRVWRQFCMRGGNKQQCDELMRPVSEYLVLVSKYGEKDLKNFIRIILWRGRSGLGAVAATAGAIQGTAEQQPSTALVVGKRLGQGRRSSLGLTQEQLASIRVPQNLLNGGNGASTIPFGPQKPASKSGMRRQANPGTQLVVRVPQSIRSAALPDQGGWLDVQGQQQRRDSSTEESDV